MMHIDSMKKNSTTETHTPKGLTQNWNFLQSYNRSSKKKTGPFVSRLHRFRDTSIVVNNPPKPAKTTIDNTDFAVKVDGKMVFVTPRVNGTYSGETQTYSKSLATKMGLI